MSDIAVKFDNVEMRFKKYKNRVDSIKEFAIRAVKKDLEVDEFYALKDVNFEVRKGDRIGIIGKNGAGKSTLLKLIAGVMKPSAGLISINGNVAPLLELGAGFDYESTGRENIFLNAAILGRRKDFIEARLDEIIDFSGLGEFIDSPVKNYSSGMRARLGFSIASQIEPEILLLDEILGVGDKDFREKSSGKMRNMISSGCTVIIVSHNLLSLKELTSKSILLEKGKVIKYGTTSDVCDYYERKATKDI